MYGTEQPPRAAHTPRKPVVRLIPQRKTLKKIVEYTGLVLTTLGVVAALIFSSIRNPPGDGAHAPQPIIDMLDHLQVTPAGTMAGYSREEFPHWIDQGHGCDTREVILVHQARSAHPGPGCHPVCDTSPDGPCWHSLYDDRDTNNPTELDIDHIVPLAEAWRSGAATWTRQRRTDFANDPLELLAVTAAENRAKGDRDPTTWMPKAGRCPYADMWITVKNRYQLSVDPAELAALRRTLADCTAPSTTTGGTTR